MPTTDGRVRHSRVVPCLDDRGQPTTVGAGVTADNQMVLLGPPGGAAILTAAQAEAYLEIVTEMLVTASSPTAH